MNNRPTVQTTLFGGSVPPSQKNSQITQHKASQQPPMMPPKSSRKPNNNTPRGQDGPNDFLLNNWNDYFGDGNYPNFNVTQIEIFHCPTNIPIIGSRF